MKTIPLLEFDDKKGIIEPSEQFAKLPNMPKKFVLTFFQKEVERLNEDIKVEKIYDLHSEMGDHPVYKFMGTDIGLFALGVGAPLAAGLFEELIALGATDFLCCGGAGVLIPKELGCLVLPNEAVRDEGTSFHYVEASRTIKVNRKFQKQVKAILDELRVDYIEGKTWTTDAFYRETKYKKDVRVYEGCLTVEMEFAAMVAVAEFRKVNFAQILFCGDDLSREVFDGRDWHNQPMIKKDLLDLCIEVLEKL